jgi:hypothetical protein
VKNYRWATGCRPANNRWKRKTNLSQRNPKIGKHSTSKRRRSAANNFVNKKNKFVLRRMFSSGDAMRHD